MNNYDLALAKVIYKRSFDFEHWYSNINEKENILKKYEVLEDKESELNKICEKKL